MAEIEPQDWPVGKIIRVPAHGGGFRVWRVTGVFLGAENQESVVELETLDRAKNTQGRMYVPVEVLDAAFASRNYGEPIGWGGHLPGADLHQDE